MKNRITTMAGAVVALLFCACSSSQADNGIGGNEPPHVTKHQRIMMADPTIVLDNGTYYLSGTFQVAGMDRSGFSVLKSTDLKEWTTGNGGLYRFILNPQLTKAYGTSGFWAPQWFRMDDGTWRFLYTANEHVAIAEGDSVTAMFAQKEQTAIDPSEGNIDPFLFRDDNGKYYLYHVRFGGGNYIWVAEFDINKGTIDKSTLKKCLDITQPWERMHNYDQSNIMEGPTVVKWDGVYYLFYSANHYKDPDYAVGYATSKSPTGPWTKYEGNPIIRRDIVGEKGSGHGDVFQGKDGTFYYVYHVWGDGDQPDARQVRIVPLVREKQPDGIYKISVDASKKIIPEQAY